MKVLAANPPAYLWDNSRHYIQAGSRWSHSNIINKKDANKHSVYMPYPFGLGYTTSLLKQLDGVRVKVVDACALHWDQDEFLNFVLNFKPDLLIVEVPTVSFPLVMRLLGIIKENIPVKIALSGAHVTALYDTVLRDYTNVDFCMLGEYEITARDLVSCLSNGSGTYEELKQIQSLAFRHGTDVITTVARPLLANLDSLPFPDREDLPIALYKNMEKISGPCAQMISSRGCPVQCIFCVTIQVIYHSPFYRRRSPENVKREIEILHDKYGAKQIWFDDDTMVIDREHVQSLCGEFLMSGLSIPWSCMADLTLDYETLRMMRQAGCIALAFGIETVNPDSIKRIHKGIVDLERAKRFVHWCKELGIMTHATYAFGLPGDSREGLEKTIRFAKELDTDTAQFSIATPFPGTPFFEEAKHNGWLTTLDWNQYDGQLICVLNYPHLSKEEIVNLVLRARRKFTKHKAWQKIKKGLFSPGYVATSIRRNDLAGIWDVIKSLVT